MRIENCSFMPLSVLKERLIDTCARYRQIQTRLQSIRNSANKLSLRKAFYIVKLEREKLVQELIFRKYIGQLTT